MIFQRIVYLDSINVDSLEFLSKYFSCEIKFDQSWGSKCYNFVKLNVLNFEFYEFLHWKMAPILKPRNCQDSHFQVCVLSKFISLEISVTQIVLSVDETTQSSKNQSEAKL